MQLNDNPALLIGIICVNGFILSLLGLILTRERDLSYPIVLTSFSLRDRGQQTDRVLLIGRPEGFWSWLLTCVGLGIEVRFSVSDNEVRRKIHSPSSLVIDSIPSDSISSVNSGFCRKLYLLVLSLLFLFISASGFFYLTFAGDKWANRDTFLVGVIANGGVSLVMFVAYLLSKRLILQVETGGGRFVGVKFKPAVTADFTISTYEVNRIVEIIQEVRQKRF